MSSLLTYRSRICFRYFKNTIVFVLSGGRIWCQIIKDINVDTEIVACFTVVPDVDEPLRVTSEPEEKLVIDETSNQSVEHDTMTSSPTVTTSPTPIPQATSPNTKERLTHGKFNY